MSITTDTRWDSFEKVNKKSNRSRLYSIIISTLKESNTGLTARNVAVYILNK